MNYAGKLMGFISLEGNINCEFFGKRDALKIRSATFTNVLCSYGLSESVNADRSHKRLIIFNIRETMILCNVLFVYE